MRTEHLTTKELINYLDFTSTDPLVRRLIQLLQEDSLAQSLTEVGMDPVGRTFEHDWQHLSPSNYIVQLRNDAEYYMDERDQMEQEKDELEREVTRLSTLSLVNFIADVHHKMEMNTMERDRAVKRAEQERELRKEAEQKFEFWDKMNHGVK
jgi:DNA-binding helix-hairpin-helix protein with protein kinase domain